MKVDIFNTENKYKIIYADPAWLYSVIMSHIEEHSKKPAETRDRIVKLMAGGGLPKIELFARQCIDGWDCWGNEV